MGSFKSYYYFKPPVSDSPLHRLPEIKTNRMSFTEIWLRYPNDNEIYPMYAAESMVAQCELRTLMHEICAVSFRADQAPMKMGWERALGFQTIRCQKSSTTSICFTLHTSNSSKCRAALLHG
jgi:hypothetical protein